MDDLISRQDAIKALGEEPEVWVDSDYEIASRTQWNTDRLAIETVPSAQQYIKAAYEQGRIQGHVEMRTELLMQLKEIVGDEVWKNI